MNSERQYYFEPSREGTEFIIKSPECLRDEQSQLRALTEEEWQNLARIATKEAAKAVGAERTKRGLQCPVPAWKVLHATINY